MKKIIILVVIFILMLIPIPHNIKDGGSKEYKAILYSVTKVHRLSNQSYTGYEDGWKIKIFGIKVYDVINVTVKTANKDISFYVKEDTLSSEGASFVISNNSDTVYCFGAEYSIEVKTGDKWKELEPDEMLSWNDILYILQGKEEREININFTFGYNELSKGKYRLVKKIFKESNENTVNTNVEKIYAEFEIK